MAKKRVHEIAKEKGISSKEVLAVLQRAGLDVKVAASSVDEADVARAFGADGSGGAAADPDDGGAPAERARPGRPPSVAPVADRPARPAVESRRRAPPDVAGGS